MPGPHLLCRPDDFRLLTASSSPSTKLIPLVEQQISRSLAILHGESGEGLILGMKLHHALKVNRAEHIHVVQNELAPPRCRPSRKNHAAFFSPPPVSSNTLPARISIRMPKLSFAFRYSMTISAK